MPDDVILKKLSCGKCGWVWFPRTNNVRMCPHCKCYSFNKRKGVRKYVRKKNDQGKLEAGV